MRQFKWEPGLGAWVMLGFLAFYMVAKFVFLYRQRGQPYSYLPMFPAFVGLSLLPVLFVGIVLAGWDNWAAWRTVSGEFDWVHLFAQGLWCPLAVAELSSTFWPGRRMLAALGQVAIADERIKWAQLWVDGCNTMIAQGVPSPLAEAQAQVEQMSRGREQALAQLQQLGYRARFAPEHIST